MEPEIVLVEGPERQEERALKRRHFDVEEHPVAGEPEAAHVRVFRVLGHKRLRLHRRLEMVADERRAVLDGAFEHPLHLRHLIARLLLLVGRRPGGHRALRRGRRGAGGDDQADDH